MGFPRELKTNVDGFAKELKAGVEHVAGEVRDSFGDLKERMSLRVSHGAEEVEAAMADAPLGTATGNRKPSLKFVLGIVASVAGIALIGAAVLVARRRARPVNLLQRGLREGSRFAVLIPIGLQKARQSVEHLSHEAALQWDKLPRVQVKLK